MQCPRASAVSGDMTSFIPAGENAGAAGDSGTLTSGGSTPGECIGGGVAGGEGEEKVRGGGREERSDDRILHSTIAL